MALTKSKTYDNGTSGNYWRAIPNLAQPRLVTMVLYADKDHAKSGKPPIKSETYQLAGAGLTKAAVLAAASATPPKNLWELCYDLAKVSKKDKDGKETNFWADATDDV